MEDYRTDWTKTRLAPGGKVIVVDLKALNEIYQLVILGLIKEPDFVGVMTVDEKIEKLQKFIKDNPKEIEEAKKSEEWKKYLEEAEKKRLKENKIELKPDKINNDKKDTLEYTFFRGRLGSVYWRGNNWGNIDTVAAKATLERLLISDYVNEGFSLQKAKELVKNDINNFDKLHKNK